MAMTKAEETLLIKANMDVVHAIASKFARRGYRKEDLIQEGCIGLLQGIRKWDATLGASVRTYATQWIRHHIQRAVGYNGYSYVDPPRFDSMDTDSLEVDNELTLHETLASGVFESPEETAIRRERVSRTLTAMETLGITEREIAILKGNIIGEESLQDVGEGLGISRERTRQIRDEIVQLVAGVAVDAA